MVEFGKYLQRNCVQEWRAHYVRYEALKKLLKRLAAAREAREKAEAAERTSPPDDEEQIDILTMTEPPVHAPAAAGRDMGFDYESVLRRGPEMQVEEKPLESLLTCLNEDTPGGGGSAGGGGSGTADPATADPATRPGVSEAVATALLIERELEMKFLRMLDEDARTVDNWFRQQKRYLREQLLILEQQSRELKAADKRAERYIRSGDIQHAGRATPLDHSPPGGTDPSPTPTQTPPSSAAAAGAAATGSGMSAAAHAAVARARNRMGEDGLGLRSRRDAGEFASPDSVALEQPEMLRASSMPVELSELEARTARAALLHDESKPMRSHDHDHDHALDDEHDHEHDPHMHLSHGNALLDRGPSPSDYASSATPLSEFASPRSPRDSDPLLRHEENLSLTAAESASAVASAVSASGDHHHDTDADASSMTHEQRVEAEEMRAMDAKLRLIQDQRDREAMRIQQHEHDAALHDSDNEGEDGVGEGRGRGGGTRQERGGAGGRYISVSIAPRMHVEGPQLISPFSSLLHPAEVGTAAAGGLSVVEETPEHTTTADGVGIGMDEPATAASVAARSLLPSSRSTAAGASVASAGPSTAGSTAGSTTPAGTAAVGTGTGGVAPLPPPLISSASAPSLKLDKHLKTLVVTGLHGVEQLAAQGLHGVEQLNVHARLRMRLLSSRKPWETLRTAFKELYRGIALLRDFKMHNYTAFLKILKKHDKLSAHHYLHGKCMGMLNSMHVFASNELHHLQLQVEAVFARDFNFGNRKQALHSLKPTHTPMSWLVSFRLGLLLGLSLALAIVLGFLGHFVSLRINTALSVKLSPVLPIYRGLFLVILHLWLWGLNVHNFKKTRINYVFIFEIDPKSELEGPQVLQIASLLTFLWFLSLDLYLATQLLQDYFPGLVPGYFHLALYLLCLFGALCPFNILARDTRIYVATTLWHIVTTGWGPVAFRDFYTCNQLCSLVNVLNDLSYGICYYCSGDFLTEESSFCKEFSSETQWVIALLPYWFRFAQCLKRYKDSGARRQLYNAGKYALSLNTTFWSSMNKHFPHTVFTNVWVGCAVVSTLVSYSWDIKADWGLLEWRKAPPGSSFRTRMNALFLRRQRVLRWSAIYYWAMVSDGLFRTAWVLTISTPDALHLKTGIPSDWFKSIIYSFEILRRNQWNFFRLENEHLANVDKERVINIVTLKRKGAEGAAAAHAAAAAAAGGVASDSAPAMPTTSGELLVAHTSRRRVMCPTPVVYCGERSVRWVARRWAAFQAWYRGEPPPTPTPRAPRPVSQTSDSTRWQRAKTEVRSVATELQNAGASAANELRSAATELRSNLAVPTMYM